MKPYYRVRADKIIEAINNGVLTDHDYEFMTQNKRLFDIYGFKKRSGATLTLSRKKI